MNLSTRRVAALSCCALALAGCATFSADGGFDAVSAQARQQLGGEVRWARSDVEHAKSSRQVADLLQHPLSAQDAVQIALLNNRGLQAAFEELGISEADLVQSGRLPNPSFTLRHTGIAAQYDIEESLSFSLLSLLTAPTAHAIEKQRFAAAQDVAVLEVIRLANDTRQAFYAALAARESAAYLLQVRSAADTSQELARRMVAAGNWSALDQAREQGFSADAAQRSSRAAWMVESTLERLLRLMGLPDSEGLRLAERLPELPQRIEEMANVEDLLLRNRIDLRVMRLQIDVTAKRLGLTQATRFVNVLDVGPARVLQGSSSQPFQRGYAVTLEVPIFDGGAPRLRRAQAVYAQAIDRYAQAAIEARSQIRQAYAAYRTTFEIAKRQRDDIVPARRLIAEQNLLRYNAAQLSVFDLLSDAQAQIASSNDYIQSLRDFWIAKSELDGALLGNSPH